MSVASIVVWAVARQTACKTAKLNVVKLRPFPCCSFLGRQPLHCVTEPRASPTTDTHGCPTQQLQPSLWGTEGIQPLLMHWLRTHRGSLQPSSSGILAAGTAGVGGRCTVLTVNHTEALVAPTSPDAATCKAGSATSTCLSSQPGECSRRHCV
jgi:hypothetical protein